MLKRERALSAFAKSSAGQAIHGAKRQVMADAGNSEATFMRRGRRRSFDSSLAYA